MAPPRKTLKIGEKYGRLTVTGESYPIRRYGRLWYVYPCKCDCGCYTVATYSALSSGGKKTCGCGPSARQRDITGERFGRLTAVFPTEKRQAHTVVWHCVCDCGNETDVSLNNLKNGSVRSCGCLNAETSAINIIKNANVHDGINEASVKFNVTGRTKKNNTSGATGVYWSARDSKWIAEITFRGKRRRLLITKDKAAAIRARKTAEIDLYGDLYEKYADERR